MSTPSGPPLAAIQSSKLPSPDAPLAWKCAQCSISKVNKLFKLGCLLLNLSQTDRKDLLAQDDGVFDICLWGFANLANYCYKNVYGDTEKNNLITFPNAKNCKLGDLMEDATKCYVFFSDLSEVHAKSKSPLFFVWSEDKAKTGTIKGMRQAMWTIFLPWILLWPLISYSAGSRSRKTDDSPPCNRTKMTNAQMYTIPLKMIHPEMMTESIHLCPFNPLGKIRATGQDQNPDTAFDSCFVMWTDLVDDCADMPEWWRAIVVDWPC